MDLGRWIIFTFLKNNCRNKAKNERIVIDKVDFFKREIQRSHFLI